jgi:putative aldouronate transport system substrate-binding protein
MRKKILALLVLGIFVCSGLFGCTQTGAPTTTAPATTAAQTTAPAAEPTATPQQPLTEITLPIVTEPTTLTYFVEINTAELSYYSNLGDTPAAKEIAKRTGVTMKFIHPPAGQGEEQFNLMVAGGELPDIVPALFYTVYKGGVDAAIKDGLIVDVKDLVELYAPNFKKQVLSNDIARKIVINDNGTLTGFGCSVTLDREYGEGHDYVGPMVRKDLLEKSGLPLPKTMDDWYKLLTKFKEMGVKIPFAWGHNGKDWDPMLGSFVFSAAYETAFNHGTQKGFFDNKGTVEYGPINEGYRKMLEMFNKWYAEGLLNKDFATQTYLEHVKYQSSTGEAGAAIHHLFEYGTIAADMDAKGYSMVPAPQPVLYEGQKLNYNAEGGWWVGAEGAYITTKCKTPEVAVKWIDWMYTDEAKLIVNWGIEGESYVMVDGKPQFSEKFLADKTRMNMLYAPNALKYTVDSTQDDAQYNLPVQRDAWAMWSDANDVYSNDVDYRFKPGMNFTEEENTRFTEIMTEVRTYAEEMFMKFVMGLEPLSNYDAYVAKIKDLGVEEARQIYQKVLDRYNSR